jgi:ABC-type nitrate/sulfonate/bicarbonate transport system permease component
MIILSFWEISAWLEWVNPFFISRPTEIAAVLKEQIITGELFRNLYPSLFEFIVGFGLAVIVGVPLGIFSGWYKIMDYAIDPSSGFSILHLFLVSIQFSLSYLVLENRQLSPLHFY